MVCAWISKHIPVLTHGPGGERGPPARAPVPLGSPPCKQSTGGRERGPSGASYPIPLGPLSSPGGKRNPFGASYPIPQGSLACKAQGGGERDPSGAPGPITRRRTRPLWGPLPRGPPTQPLWYPLPRPSGAPLTYVWHSEHVLPDRCFYHLLVFGKIYRQCTPSYGCLHGILELAAGFLRRRPAGTQANLEYKLSSLAGRGGSQPFRSLQPAPPLNLQSLLQPPTPTAGHTPLISPGLGDPTP
jgi:hypothetical protein